jgi:hypothetical protein
MTSRVAGQYQSADCSVVARWADRLSLAVSPVFAAMGLLAYYLGDARALLCGVGSGISWNGMVVMYLVMSLAHLPPWLKLFSRRGDQTGRAV